jgi:MFS family permease
VLIVTMLFMFGAEQVLFVLLARDRLDLGVEGVGVLMAAAGLGGLLIAPFTGKLASSRRIDWLAGVAGVASGTALVVLAFVDSRPLALLLVGLDGMGAIVFEITVITLLQRAVAEDVLGRVYSVQDALSAVGEVAGSLLAPILAATVGLGFALATVGLVGAGISAATIPVIVALAARLEARRVELRSTTEWLATIAELADFGPAELERLARSAQVVTEIAGSVVVREGDRPDDLYVVRTGRLAVTSSSTTDPIPDLVADDLFGEIGLLRGIPRTATVTATVDSELVRIDGSVFVDVALGGAAPADPLARAVRHRLGRTHPHLVLERSHT